MPCYEVRTISVEFKARNLELLKQAVAEMGWTYHEATGRVVNNSGEVIITIDTVQDKASFADFMQHDVNKLKQTYTRKTIETLAKKKRWLLKGQGNNLTMRRF